MGGRWPYPCAERRGSGTHRVLTGATREVVRASGGLLAHMGREIDLGGVRKANACLVRLLAEEATPQHLPSFFRAAAVVAEASANAEAVALGLYELVSLLDVCDGEKAA